MTAPATGVGYERIKAHREVLASAVESLRTAALELDINDAVDALDAVGARVTGDSFKVLVLGEFRRGKSTVINALLGHKVLPAFATPTTATINEVKWGETARAVLYPRQLNGDLPAPREIPVEDLAQYVVVGDDDDAENPYDRVEVFWPLALCRNGVEIIDSPGLNDRATRERVTTNYLARVDAVLFVVAADMMMSITEVNVIERVLRPSGHDHLFFVINRINLIDEDERDRVRESGLRRTVGYTELGADGVFFVDAKGALQARTSGSDEGFERTGFPELEQALEEFLSRRRGAVKMLGPAKELQRMAQTALTGWIPRQEQFLEEELGTLERRRDAVEERLKGLELQRDLIVQRVQTHIEILRGDVVERAQELFGRLPDQFVPWAKALETESGLTLTGGSPKAQAEALATEVAEHIEDCSEGEIAKWRDKVLEPLIAARQEKLIGELEENAEDFLSELEQVRLEMSSVSTTGDAAVDPGQRDVSAAERVLAAGGGFLLGGAGGAVIGASGGLTALIKGLAPQIALAVAGLVVLGPGLALLAFVTGTGVLNSWLQMEHATGKIKRKVAEELADRVRAERYDRAAQVGDIVADAFGQIRDAAADGMSHEIAQIRNELDGAIEAKREGEASVEARRQSIAEFKPTLEATDAALGEVIAELAPLAR